MIRGIEFQNDFYYIVPKRVTDYPSGYVFNGLHLNKFNEDLLGNYNEATGANDIAIQTSFKTPMSYNLSSPNKKMFKRLKIFRTPSIVDPEAAPIPKIKSPMEKYQYRQSLE
jgi:hypothetical protein